MQSPENSKRSVSKEGGVLHDHQDHDGEQPSSTPPTGRRSTSTTTGTCCTPLWWTSSFFRKWTLSLLLTFLVGVVFAIVMEVILPQEGQWSDMEGHRCEEYCENSNSCDHTMDERPTTQQPVNAYTNLAYIWCGLVPMIFLRVDLSTFMYFCASTILAISSFMFHASITKTWMWMDGASMYIYGASMIFHGIHAVFNVSWKILSIFMLALMVAMPIVRPKITVDNSLINSGQFVVVVILAAILVLARIYKIVVLALGKQRRRKKNGKANGTASSTSSCCRSAAIAGSIVWESCKVLVTVLIPALLAGFATFVWIKDSEKEEWCNPDSSLQWHGVWHVTTGFASLWIWLFFDFNHLKDILASSVCYVDDDDDDDDDIYVEKNLQTISTAGKSLSKSFAFEEAGSTQEIGPEDEDDQQCDDDRPAEDNA